jgi:hypothetical protein
MYQYHRYLMTRLSLQVFYLWRLISSTAPPLILWWSNLEILVGPLHRSSPFIGGLRCQAIQREHAYFLIFFVLLFHMTELNFNPKLINFLCGGLWTPPFNNNHGCLPKTRSQEDWHFDQVDTFTKVAAHTRKKNNSVTHFTDITHYLFLFKTTLFCNLSGSFKE